MPVRILLILMALTLTAHQAVAQHHGTATTGRVSAQRRAQGWEKAPPDAVGLDERVLNSFDADLAGGKYSLVDTFAVYRCGKMVFERKYAHDYGQIYAKDVTQLGPLNARGTGWYNYFDPQWHPYYHGTDLHSMQSVTKTVSSIIIGVAMTRGDFKSGLDTPLMHWFDAAKVRNVDERKRRITLRHVLTMTTGIDWNEEIAYDDPKNDASRMEASDDWVQYVIDRPMAQEPGKIFNYSSGVSELLAYIFEKETGKDIEQYGGDFLFAPMGIDHFWKRTPLGTVDTEGGLFLSNAGLAKLGSLYLHGGASEGQQIVSKEWVKESLAPFTSAGEHYKYGFKWWLLPRTDRPGVVWMARGFGGQRLMVFPEEDMIAVFTGWEILKDEATDIDMVNRILPAVRQQTCAAHIGRSGTFLREIKMGRQPRSGDIPWLSAHSILNWIGGDIPMLPLFGSKSSDICRKLRSCILGLAPNE